MESNHMEPDQIEELKATNESKSSLTGILKVIAKLGLAVAICWYLYQKGDLDFGLVKQSFTDYLSAWIIGFPIGITAVLITFYRWFLLVRAATKVPVPFSSTFKAAWTGIFFFNFSPGGVTSDLVKYFILKREFSNIKRTGVLASLFFDRLLGLLGLISLAFASVMVFRLNGTEIPSTAKALFHTIDLAFLGCLGILAIIILPQRFLVRITDLVKKVPKFGDFLGRILGEFWFLNQHRKLVLSLTAMSFFSQAILMYAFYTVFRPFLDESFTFVTANTLIPIGMIITVIPLAPGGIGVGHVAFAKLFQMFGIAIGASLFNIIIVFNYMFGAVGMLVYLTSKTKKQDLGGDVNIASLAETK